MTTRDKFEALKKEWMEARTEDERQDIDVRIEALSREDPEGFDRAFYDSAVKSVAGARQLLFRSRLSKVLKIVSARSLAERIGRSPAWISQRLNGNNVNGTEAVFSDEDMSLITDAVHSIATELSEFNIDRSRRIKP